MTLWMVIPSFPNYEASDEGEIRRIGIASGATAGRILRQVLRKNGYYQVTIHARDGGKTRWVHRLVCEAFYGLPPMRRAHVAHHDGNKTRNQPPNLRWATAADNEADKKRHGRVPRGERNGNAKLTDAQADELRARAALLPRVNGGRRIKDGALRTLAAEYGVTAACVWLIASGKTRTAQ